VTTTLSALAATGGFAPDAPGTLRFDRDPPGFGAVNPRALEKLASRPRPKALPSKTKDAGPSKAELAAERRRLEREQAVRRGEQERLDASIRTTRATLERQELDLAARRTEVEQCSRTLAETKQKLRELEKRRRALGE
jgi:chromosome segregation ATPase